MVKFFNFFLKFAPPISENPELTLPASKKKLLYNRFYINLQSIEKGCLLQTISGDLSKFYDQKVRVVIKSK